MHRSIFCAGESRISDIGRPDFAVFIKESANPLKNTSYMELCGYIEVKRPGKGANPAKYREHDKKQWEKFRALPNLLYTDGNEWGLYQNGQLWQKIVRLSGNIETDGKNIASG